MKKSKAAREKKIHEQENKDKDDSRFLSVVMQTRAEQHFLTIKGNNLVKLELLPRKKYISK